MQKILIIKPSSLGDIIHSLPVLNSLNECFPEAEIHWLIARNFAPLLEEHPMIKRLWIIDKDRWKDPLNLFSTMRDLWGLGKELKKEEFQIVIDLQGLLRSGIIAFFTESPLRIGFKEARELSYIFYTHRVEGGRDIHAVERYLKVLSVLDCPVKEIVFPLPVRKLSEDKEYYEFLRGEYAVIAPGARWDTKIWPAERFAFIARRLPFKSIIIGSRDDIPISEKIVRSSDGRAISLSGKTDLKELVEIIRKARFVLCNDSGPAHIGAALGVPVFAIFGPTSPIRTGPYGKNVFVFRSEVECAPCFRKRCKSILCMESISEGYVWSKIRDYLNL
ncbi:MAG: lipopolysaccharide heptosyltransferase II [Thermodesulfovibrionales bacterium]|nr:lipopolysaccharide heptosyltransferase II [Thermodesulfovibrionales bacterium]